MTETIATPFLLQPPDPALELSLVIPCYNEAQTLPRTIPPLVKELVEHGVKCELILVRNGSKDDTGKVIDGFIAAGLPVRRVDVEVNEGYGWGVINGMRQARGAFVGYMGCDGQIAPEDVYRTWRAINRAEERTFAKVRRVSRNDGAIRWFVSRAYNLLFLVLFKAITTDVNGVPKFIHREELEKIAPTSKDWFIDAEFVIKARRDLLTFVEVPVDFMVRAGGESNVRFGTVFEFIKNMLRAKWRW
jgi:glycosyltransferase involved in cell wall biosynthesis